MTLRICNQPGCGKSTEVKFCGDHNTQIRDRERYRRAGWIRRLYDSVQWRNRTRPYILSRDPLCRIAITCGGKALSTDVDHIKRSEIYVAEHGGDVSFFFDAANLQGACHACHSYKTVREQKTGRKE